MPNQASMPDSGTTAGSYLRVLDAGIVRRRLEEGPRGHLGYSELGSDDERRLWLGFRWCMPEIRDPRVLRIFDNGNAVEDLLIKWTQESGLRLETRAPDGQQFRFEALGGHVGGGMDGAIHNIPEYPGEWMVWEAKSANDQRFKALKKASGGEYTPMVWDDLKEVGLRAWSPVYHGQAICYMGMTGMRRAMVAIYDKNRSEIHVEFVEADDLAYQTMLSKAERIVTSMSLPAPAYSGPADYRSRLTMGEDEQAVYWTQRLPPRANCRNCRFSQPLTDGEGQRWQCHFHERLCGTLEHQYAGCENHQFIPDLMPAKLIDQPAGAGPRDSLCYRTPEGHEFSNGLKDFSSEELIELAKDEFRMLGDPFFHDARQQLGARVMTEERCRKLGFVDEDIPF